MGPSVTSVLQVAMGKSKMCVSWRWRLPSCPRMIHSRGKKPCDRNWLGEWKERLTAVKNHGVSADNTGTAIASLGHFSLGWDESPSMRGEIEGVKVAAVGTVIA